MRLFIDLDQHSAVQDFTISAPAPPPQFKSQDTIDFLIYFLQAGIVQDMGAGFALKFGMIKTGDTTNTILAYQTASTYLTDPNGNVYYQMQVNFNTSQMATAIGTSPSIACTIELRYQDALAEIIHTLNLAATVFQTIIAETGVTPPNVSTGYPDASTIELLVHKNVPSGYAGLDSSSHLNGAVIPVDGQTIALNGSGQVSSAAILAYTAANFTTPASGGTVSVTFGSTANLKASSYVRISIAGYYIVNSVTDSTHALLQNNGDPFNASNGTTITSGAVVLPAQAAAAGGGTAGQNAYTTLSAGFVVPAVGATVSINVVSTAWMPGSGYALFISGAGYYLVNSITDTTHVVVINSGSAANQPPGTNVSNGGTVVGAGPQGAPGATGASLSAYDALAASFVMPAVSGTVTITISNTAWIGANQILYIATAGYVQVATIVNATMLTVTNLNYAGNATAGVTIASGSKVSPGGLQGPQGAGGPGLNAFTTLSANYTQPAVNATVTINVGTTAWMGNGQGIFVQGGGYYAVSSISDLTHAVVTNVGGSSNVAAGSTVVGNGTQTVAPAGTPGLPGTNAFTATTASFTVPTTNSTVTVIVGSTGFMAQGQLLYLPGAGYYSVSTVTDATHVVLINIGASGNATAGNTITSGTQVSPAGAVGPAGPTGAAGPTGGIGEAPTDGQLYGRKSSAWSVVSSGGGGLTTADVGIEWQEDFNCTLNSCRFSFGGAGVTNGIGSTVGVNATAKGAGIAFMGAGGASGNRSVVVEGTANASTDANAASDHYVAALGILDLRFRVWIPTTYTSASNYSIMRFGLITDDSTGIIKNGIFFEYNYSQNSGNWIGTTASNGTLTRNNSSTAVAAGAWINLRILTDAAWANITWYVNGTSVATASSPALPTNPIPVNMYNAFAAGAGLSTVYVDWVYLKYSYSRGIW